MNYDPKTLDIIYFLMGFRIRFLSSINFTRVATMPNFDLGETWYFYAKEL